MWTDIDYYDRRRVFSLDPERFPLDKMRGIAQYLHDHQQQYILMVDPAVGHVENPAYQIGNEMDIFLKAADRTSGYFRGVVWPVRLKPLTSGPKPSPSYSTNDMNDREILCFPTGCTLTLRLTG